jgi:hypothetical protein
MKKNVIRAISLVLAVLFTLALVSCNTVAKEGLWEDAIHRRDMEFGKGAVTVTVEVAAGEDKVTFTIHTDEKMLDKALLEHELIEAKEGQFGLYITKANGILASDDDKAYWAIYVNGEYGMNGISATPVTEGTVYKLEYTNY